MHQAQVHNRHRRAQRAARLHTRRLRASSRGNSDPNRRARAIRVQHVNRAQTAVGLTSMRAVISPEFTSFTLSTRTSAACVLPVDALSEASGGEITTVAPGLKFAPTSVICTW